MAIPLRFSKYVATKASEGAKMMPPPIPVTTPWVIIRCQYEVERLIVKIPISCKVEPTRNVGTQNPASSKRPEKALPKKVNQTWIEPIHEIWKGV